MQANFLHNVREGLENRQEHRITLGSSIADCRQSRGKEETSCLSTTQTSCGLTNCAGIFFHKVYRARECRTRLVISLEAQHMPLKPSPFPTFPLHFFSTGRNYDKWQNSNVDLILSNVSNSEHI